MRKFLAAIGLFLIATLPAPAQTVPLGPRFVLPYQTVVDATGVPIPGALLNFYSSGTNSRLNTYSDPLLTVPNANPVVANAAGVFPNIFLNGDYKVVLTDSSLNQIWTADPVEGGAAQAGTVVGPTVSVVGCAAPWANTSGTLLGNNCGISFTGTLPVLNGFSITAAPFQTVSPTGNTPNTLSTANFQTGVLGTTAAVRRFLFNLGMTVNSTAGSGGGEGDVIVFAGMDCQSGAGNCWDFNPLMQLDTGYTGIAQMAEWDLNNNAANLLVTTTTAGSGALTLPSQYDAGISISGSGSFRNTAAYNINGAKWQYGWLVPNGVDITQAVWAENTSAAWGIQILGTHASGAGQFRSGTNEDILIRGPIDLGSGSSISSVNDANSSTEPLEIISSNTLFTGINITLGVNSGNLGTLILEGSTSGALTQVPQAVAGTPTVTWGTSSGTPAVTASAPLAISATTGNISCATCATTSSTITLGSTAMAIGSTYTTIAGAITWSGTPTFSSGTVNELVGSSYSTLNIGTNYQQGASFTGIQQFPGENASGATINFVQNSAVATVVTAGSEAGSFRIATYQAGALANRLEVDGGTHSGGNVDEGIDTANFSGYYAAGTKGVTCSGALTVIASVTIKDGIITAATGTGGTCS